MRMEYVKMKTKLIITILGILLFGIVSAALIILQDDKTISSDRINATERADLETKGIGSWDYTDRPKGNYIERDLISRSGYKLPTIKVEISWRNCTVYNETLVEWNETIDDEVILRSQINRAECLNYEVIDYTSEEIDDMLDEKEIIKMKQIARAIRMRSNLTQGEIIRNGSTTIEI